MNLRRRRIFQSTGSEYLEEIKHNVLKNIAQNSGFTNRTF